MPEQAPTTYYTLNLASALRWLLALLPGPGPARPTQPRIVVSRPRRTAFARSVVLGSNFEDVLAPYNLEGRQVMYEIDGSGVVRRTVGDAAPTVVGADSSGDARAFSFQEKRLGTELVASRFDLIAAGGDRVIAKVEGDDRIFVGVVDHPYVHFVDGARVRLPQCLFKLDPELAKAGASVEDLVKSVRPVPVDNEVHPATERFPLFRYLFGSGLGSGLAQFGLWEQMNMRFVPEAWHELDSRPLRATADPPEGFERYVHVEYDNGDSGEPPIVKKSVKYQKVLDLGVGVTHLHEQHDNRFGGELDSLDIIPIRLLRELTGVTMSADEAYQLANGPMQDYGGWVDGTCVYYMLVRLKEFNAANREDRRNSFAVLWTDEQTGFTMRWRLLDLADRTFGPFFPPIIGVVTDSESREAYYPFSPFDPDRFWSPLAHGAITDESRMGVARQIVALTGQDPESDAREIYTIHFSWGTMDRSWRWRRFPTGGDGVGRWQCLDDQVVEDSFRIREDTTMVLAGWAKLGTDTVQGWWCQRYLPASGQEQPAVGSLWKGTKPEAPFAHAWRFVSDVVFRAADSRFSHFGVYEPATGARHQAYRVRVHSRVPSAMANADIAGSEWIDDTSSLTITHKRLNWTKLADALSGGGGQANEAIEDRTSPSIYNSKLRFAMRHWSESEEADTFLLTHADVRDEKLKAFDLVGAFVGGDPMTVRLRAAPSSPLGNATIEISLDAHLRNDVRALHGVRVTEEIDAVSPPQVTTAIVTVRENGGVMEVSVAFTLARHWSDGSHQSFRNHREWASVNVSSVRVGALFDTHRNRLDDPVLYTWQHPDWTNVSSGTGATGVWPVEPAHPRAAELQELLSERGAAMYGTSVWFVGATGLVAPADDVIWING